MVDGAERHAERPRTRAAVSTAPDSRRGRRNRLIVVLVGVLIVATMVGGVLYASGRAGRQAARPIPVSHVTARYPVSADPRTGVITAGRANAKVTVDVYEDFLCPHCAAFYRAFDARMRQAMTAGKLRVRYHMLNFLDENSDPPGYSGRAANAAIAAAVGGRFVSFYASLYRTPPKEGSAGYTGAQLVRLGRQLGLGRPFATAVRNGRYLDAVHRDYRQARRTVGKAFYDGGFATPTVVHNERLIDYQDHHRPRDWLAPLLAGSTR